MVSLVQGRRQEPDHDPTSLRVLVLGPLEVHRDGRALPLPGRQERRVLTALALHPSTRVSVDHLVALLWADAPPRTAGKTLQAIVSRVRTALGSDGQGLVTWREDGYLLHVDPDAVDAVRFEQQAVEGRERLRAGDPHAAAIRLRDALDLWRADEPADLGHTPTAVATRTTLTEGRFDALEHRIEADLALGRHADVIGELEALVHLHPYREPFLAQLMLALYGSGRQADALAAFAAARQRLADDLGTVPSPALEELRARIDAHDPALQPPAPPPRTTLPAEVSSFVGRARELEDVDALLGQARLVTLTGAGGAGKSRLAVRAARSAAPRHRGGTCLVDLATLDTSEAVEAATASALGASEASAAGIAATVGGREVLLVFDNGEHVLDGVRRLVQELLRACPRATVLTTSRGPLGVPGEHVVEILPLPVPVAVQLFADRARAADRTFTLDDTTTPVVEELCRRLDGLPLAIELAAARVRSLPPAELAHRLDQRLRLLTSDRAGRHRSLAATIAWSYDLLTPGEQAVFRRLAVYAGSFTLDAAERLCALTGVDDGDVAALVAGLAEQSLLSAWASGRYRMLEGVRSYGLQRLAEGGEHDDVRLAHATAATELAEREGARLRAPEEGRAVQCLEAELDDLRAAHAWASAAGHVDLALRLPYAMRWFAFSTTRTEVYGWAATAARQYADSDHELLAEVAGMAALGASYTADADVTRRLAARANEIATRAGRNGSVLATLALVRTALHRGDLEDALRLADELIVLDDQIGDGMAASRWRVGRLLALSYAGRHDEAMAGITRLRDTAHRAPCPSVRAWVLYGYGEVFSETDPDEALRSLREAIAVARSVGNRMVEGIASVTVASVAGRFGEPMEAAHTFEEVIALWHDRGAWTHLWTTLRNLVELLARTGDLAEAVTLERATATSPTAPPVYGDQGERLASVVARAQRELPADVVEAARLRGATMTDEDAVAFAKVACRRRAPGTVA